MTTRCADPTFGIKAQALAILQLLAGTDPTFADWDDRLRRYLITITTFPWYNGRERGACLVMSPGPYREDNPVLHIAFGEDRGSTDIFVEQWEAPEPFNCPTLEDRGDEASEAAYEERTCFHNGEIGKAADYIIDCMIEFYAKAKQVQS